MTHSKTVLRPACAAFTLFSFTFGLITFIPRGASAQIRRDRPATTQPTETLTGDKAVRDLKRTGGYDSLREAFSKATGSQTENLLPGGSTEEIVITSADGAANDQFGKIALSGNTVAVGASSDDVGANTDQGSVYVFIRAGNTWTQQAQLNASDGAANDLFGTSVALSQDTLVVGADSDDIGSNLNQGAAYVFTRSGSNWTQQAKLTSSDGAANDRFGDDVAVSVNTVVVTAPNDDVGANTDQGSAYVFTRSGTTWTQQAKLLASDGALQDVFGSAVAVSGDTAIVGARLDNVGSNITQGSAYVFTRSGTTWTQQAQLLASDGSGNDYFGSDVALEGDTVVVGALVDDIGSNANQGSAYIFTRSGTTWTQQSKLVASDGAASDYFGGTVAISDRTVVVTASLADIGGNANQGAVYVFTGSGATWTQQDKLTSSDGAANDGFGANGAEVAGDTVVVAASSDDVGANTDQGSVSIFQTKMSAMQVTASDGGAGDSLGSSVAVSGDTAVVGAYGSQIGGNTFQGSAYVFLRTGSLWSQQAKLVASDGGAGDLFGSSVAISGDTVIVGALDDPFGGNPGNGSVYVFIRSGTTWTQQAKLLALDGALSDSFGASVSLSGDTAVVGAIYDDVGANAEQGSAYVFTRSGATWTQEAQLVAADGAVGDFFGGSVALSGDTVVVGASRDDFGAVSNQGSAYVFTRSGTNWSQQAKLTASDGASADRFGTSVAISGETLVVGADYDNVGSKTDQGSAYVFTRSGTNWTQQAQLTASDGAANDFFGYSVAVSNDTVVVGAYAHAVSANNGQGAAYVFSRSGTIWSQERKLIDSAGAATDYFGVSVAIDAESVVVGANNVDVSGNSDEGAAYIYYWGSLAPTAAGSRLTGRVMTSDGRGLRNAMVVVTASDGIERVTQTGTFGQFAFENLPSGETYVLSVRSRRHQFTPQAISLQSDLDGVRLQPSGSRR